MPDPMITRAASEAAAKVLQETLEPGIHWQKLGGAEKARYLVLAERMLSAGLTAMAEPRPAPVRKGQKPLKDLVWDGANEALIRQPHLGLADFTAFVIRGILILNSRLAKPYPEDETAELASQAAAWVHRNATRNRRRPRWLI